MKTITFDPKKETVIVLKEYPQKTYIAGDMKNEMMLIAGAFFLMPEIEPALAQIIKAFIDSHRFQIHEFLCKQEREIPQTKSQNQILVCDEQTRKSLLRLLTPTAQEQNN